ncbi:MAG: hypothetical protein WA294_06285 [Acidobacteriaceae bacterium]
MANQVLRPLRRTITPYLGQTLIFGAITVFCVCVAYDKRQWGLLWTAAFVWALFALYVILFGLKYLVLWDDASIVMRASGLQGERRIQFGEISRVHYETAASHSRPFRRIVVHGLPPTKTIDISIRHFRLNDIDELLTAIRIRRPNIEIPAIPIPGPGRR